MRVISLHQPFASLIMMGLKKHETRHWAPPASYVGQRIGIHAAKKMWTPPAIPHDLVKPFTQATPWINPPRGALLGTAVIAEVYQSTPELVSKADEFDVLAGDWTEGRWLWRLEDVRHWPEPVPMTGRQGWWSVDWEAADA